MAQLRKIAIYGRTWQFCIGRSVAVIYDPEGKRHLADLSVVTGRSNDTIARGRWKRTSDGMVTPAHVRDYIELRLA